MSTKVDVKSVDYKKGFDRGYMLGIAQSTIIILIMATFRYLGF